MDRKQTVIAIGVAMAFMVGWYFLVGYVERTYGPADVGKQNQTATNTPTPPAAPGTQPTTGPTTGASTPQMTAAPAGLQVIDSYATPAGVTLGSAQHKDKTYALQLEVAPAGAGVAGVVLNDFLGTRLRDGR